MRLKTKTVLIISILFTIVFAISIIIIYLLFADFRKDEFQNRLKEKAISSIKLLVEVEQIDKQLLKVIDQNSINKLYNEKTLIFDANFNLIYSSIDDTKIIWTIQDLKKLKNRKKIFKKDNENEIYGFYYDTNEEDYYALVSAQDNYGKRKLEYLFYILISTYLISTTFTWLLSYRIVKRLLMPIDQFHKRISNISDKNLDSKIEIKANKDEIDLLAIEFNLMLERINKSYKKQLEFTANASHELRTPITRIIAQLENKIIKNKEENFNDNFNELLLDDINQLSKLTDSLLLLSKLDVDLLNNNELCRIDEIIFDASDNLNKIFPDFRMEFEITDLDNIEVKGNKALFEIAFENLFRNAYLYSNNKTANVLVSGLHNQLIVTISNNGDTITKEEQNKLFEPFMRGKNATNKSGMGLGLRIVKRILNLHNVSISYFISPENKNSFLLTFSV